VKIALDRIEDADDIPGAWDILASDYYQKRTFLAHCQQYNPCSQRYYLLSNAGRLHAGGIVYTLKLDLLTYLGIRSPMNMQIVGVPCSVSSSGLVGIGALQGELLRRILCQEKGLVACLNLDTLPENVPSAVGRTWPDIVFANSFHTWEEYSSTLRSPYRRRLLQVQEYATSFTLCTGPCCSFTREMHAMYLQVFNRSQGKLERLETAFFRKLPESFCLTTYAAGGTLRGWTITQRDGDRFSFFLGGQDYRYNPKKLYLVQLMTVLRQGIASGAKLIDLGQSAEVPKMRLGGIPREKIMLGSHSRPMLRAMLHVGIGLLSYRKHFPETHVFRDGAP
jgi:hypothetical protein